MQQSALEGAFDAYRARVDEIAAHGDWSQFADLYTPRAIYRRHGYPDFVGREAIRSWIRQAMTTYPGNLITGFEVVWRAFDSPNDQVVFELRNVMRDPGDGSVHAASTVTQLTYAGDGLWSRSSDIHNPFAYEMMVRNWERTALRMSTPAPGTALPVTLEG
jgi:hypothetical protein